MAEVKDKVDDPLSFGSPPEDEEDVQLFEEVPRSVVPNSATATQNGQPAQTRFAFDARIDDLSVTLDTDDPLSDTLRHSSLGDDPLSGGGVSDPLADDPLAPGRKDSGSTGSDDIPLNDDDAGTTRIDTFASYGQLLTEDYVRQNSGRNFDAEADEAADVVFRRKPPEAARESAAASAPAGPSDSPPALQQISRDAGIRSSSRPEAPSRRRIAVSDPVKKVEGSLIPGMKGGYVQYKVEVQDPERGTATSVRRRFRDFVSLADLLKLTHRGYFIPPRPEKQPNLLEAQVPDSGFVAGRCQALETWLRQLSAHPVIGHSQELRLFLEAAGQLAGDPEWTHLHPSHGNLLEGFPRLARQVLGQERAVPLPSEAAQSTRATTDLLRRYKETATSYKHHPPPSEAELDLMAQKERLDEWSAVLSEASRRAEALALAFEDAGGRTGDVGLSLIKLGRFQDDDPGRGGRPARYTAAGQAATALSAHSLRTGKAAVVVARVSKGASEPLTDALEPLHEALALAPAASKALRQREESLLTMQALHDEADAKSAAIAQLEAEGSKAFGTQHSKARKVAALQEEVRALQEAEVAAGAEYERVRGRNIEELQRWEKVRAEAFARMLADLAAVQHAFHQKSASVWQMQCRSQLADQRLAG